MENEIEKINTKLEVINSIIRDINQLKEENGIFEPEPTFITEQENLEDSNLELEEQEEFTGVAGIYEKSEE